MMIDVQHIHAGGDTPIIEFIGKGTHRGKLAGIAPTGRRIEMPVITPWGCATERSTRSVSTWTART
jgi:hypothetical protein